MLAYLLEAWMEVPDFAEWLHGILTQHKLEELSKAFIDFQKNTEGISELANELKQQNISHIAFSVSPNRIVDAKYSCTDLDIKHYYMVDNRFMTMFKVISAGHDIPHREARQKVIGLSESCRPVIIAGNGGLGKTSLMMHTAVQWASYGRVAVWLSLSNEDVITEQRAAAFFRHFTPGDYAAGTETIQADISFKRLCDISIFGNAGEKKTDIGKMYSFSCEEWGY